MPALLGASLRSGRVLQEVEMRLRRFCGEALDGAVAGDQFFAERRQPRPAAMLAAGLREDDRLAEDLAEFVDEIPGPAIGHLHGAARRRDRAGAGDRLQQGDLARADAALRVEVDADAERCHHEMRARTNWSWRNSRCQNPSPTATAVNSRSGRFSLRTRPDRSVTRAAGTFAGYLCI